MLDPEARGESGTWTVSYNIEVRDSPLGHRRASPVIAEVGVAESVGDRHEDEEASGTPCTYVSGSTMRSVSMSQSQSRTRSTASAAQIPYFAAQVEYMRS